MHGIAMSLKIALRGLELRVLNPSSPQSAHGEAELRREWPLREGEGFENDFECRAQRSEHDRSRGVEELRYFWSMANKNIERGDRIPLPQFGASTRQVSRASS